MIAILLTVICLAVPAVAALVEFVVSAGLSERHHSHHDTYVMSSATSSVFVMAMVFMGVLGLVFAWLCRVNVFNADEVTVLGFFASFEVVVCIMWLAMRRYNVSTYDTYMEITPFVGPKRVINYSDIEHLRWSGFSGLAGSRSISVIVNGKNAGTLLGSLDLEQILLRINRDDLFDDN